MQVSVFLNNYFAAIQSLINSIETLRVLNDQVSQNSALLANPPANRTDLNASALAATYAAAQTMVTAFDGGSPPVKASLFNVL